ncbi:hypothetical protein [Enterococcus songbeiensis]|uniref:hypothetical protein n=1 Tax=Enterococcus songbeiensis TaxID=2559927 RepID=UPI00148542F2|nr:hypothetical protein [Enterococcus songbeiensis]
MELFKTVGFWGTVLFFVLLISGIWTKDNVVIITSIIFIGVGIYGMYVTSKKDKKN